jgi:hypothetical protein
VGTEIIFGLQIQRKMKYAVVNNIYKLSLQSKRVYMYDLQIRLRCEFVDVHIFQQVTSYLQVPGARTSTCGSCYTE